MSIKHAILGMLSNMPMSGYDLKKVMQDSAFMHWSGNNNQIYKALVDLHEDGLVTNEILHQGGSPSKKVYTITKDGLAELKRWTLSEPEIPEVKNSFLVKLAWAEQLSNSELRMLLNQYEQAIKSAEDIERASGQRSSLTPKRTKRETAIWELLRDNILSSYANELEWISRVRQMLDGLGADEATEPQDTIKSKEDEKMKFRIIDKNNRIYVMQEPEGKCIQTEQDGLELVAGCVENGTNLLLIPGECLSDEFTRLRTGVAGAVLQRLTMYGIKTAVVLSADDVQGRFKEFLLESNRGSAFRAYADFAEAEKWLLGGF